MDARPVHLANSIWYLPRAEARRHGFIVALRPDRYQVRAFDVNGVVLDQIEQTVTKP